MRLTFLFEAMVTPESDPDVMLLRAGMHLTLTSRRRPRYTIGTAMMQNVRGPQGEEGYFTVHNHCSQGYGPLMYDLAIEIATKEGKGLIPATGARSGANTVNSDAVWRHYFEKRSDVEKTPMPNVGQIERPWLATIYRKEPKFLDIMGASGRLISRDDKWEFGRYGEWGPDPSLKTRQQGQIVNIEKDVPMDKKPEPQPNQAVSRYQMLHQGAERRRDWHKWMKRDERDEEAERKTRESQRDSERWQEEQELKRAGIPF